MGLDGAEAILTLRTVISNGDFEKYWRFHLGPRAPVALPRHGAGPVYARGMTHPSLETSCTHSHLDSRRWRL